ncbi:uncharacterized protein LOC143363939 [Halictus rubicundus]|uniref:uncharacterized protein LOC143363939 n=1 Tax=Halictus rubicundus TaxID=77578 RepID=UPI00403527CA
MEGISKTMESIYPHPRPIPPQPPIPPPTPSYTMHPPGELTIWHYNDLVKRMDHMNQKIDKLLSRKDRPRHYGRKPDCLPLQTREDVDNFENCSDEQYNNVVDYFAYLGGSNLKEALSASFRESLTDSLLQFYTWFGKESRQPLYLTKIVRALFDAACESRAFARPTRLEYQDSMRVVLKARKERVWHKKPTNSMRPPNPWEQGQQQ